jgi:UDPglucose 6-dehydrogenase
MKIGIIGYGYVGKAVASAYEESQVLINDPLYKDSVSIDAMKADCKAIFVCVPTPPFRDGSCDTDILVDTVSKLTGYAGYVIIKSTATPQVYIDLESKYSDMKIAHVPEFLTAANAILDYQCPVNIVVGCKPELRMDIISIILTDKIHFDMTTAKFCSISEAAMFKYVANTMLAMKVVINNEYYDLCRSLGISWDNIAKIAETDPRLGSTHWKVPGPDGSRGFAGACFPKDVQALLTLAKFMGSDPSMLEAAVKKNQKLRHK